MCDCRRRAVASNSSSAHALRSECTSAIRAASPRQHASIKACRSPSGSASASLKIASIRGSISDEWLLDDPPCWILWDGLNSVREKCERNESQMSGIFTGFGMQAAKEPTLDESHVPID